MAGIVDAASGCDRRDVALDRVVEELEHAVGHLSLYQAIAVRRIVERFLDDERRVERCLHCPWG